MIEEFQEYKPARLPEEIQHYIDKYKDTYLAINIEQFSDKVRYIYSDGSSNFGNIALNIFGSLAVSMYRYGYEKAESDSIRIRCKSITLQSISAGAELRTEGNMDYVRLCYATSLWKNAVNVIKPFTVYEDKKTHREIFERTLAISTARETLTWQANREEYTTDAIRCTELIRKFHNSVNHKINQNTCLQFQYRQYLQNFGITEQEYARNNPRVYEKVMSAQKQHSV